MSCPDKNLPVHIHQIGKLVRTHFDNHPNSLPRTISITLNMHILSRQQLRKLTPTKLVFCLLAGNSEPTRVARYVITPPGEGRTVFPIGDRSVRVMLGLWPPGCCLMPSSGGPLGSRLHSTRFASPTLQQHHFSKSHYTARPACGVFKDSPAEWGYRVKIQHSHYTDRPACWVFKDSPAEQGYRVRCRCTISYLSTPDNHTP